MGKYSTRGRVERSYSTRQSIVSSLSDILYFLVVWLGEIFYSSQATANFGDQDISKCLNNLFLIVEQTDRISLAILVTYNVAYCICPIKHITVLHLPN